MPSRKIWNEYPKAKFIIAAIIFFALVIGSLFVTVVFVPAFFAQVVNDFNLFSLVSLFWSLLFPLWLVYAILFLLRIWTSTEWLHVDETTFTIKRIQLGITRWREYEAKEVKQLRVFPVHNTMDERTFVVFGITHGTLGFDYQNKAIRFGTSLDEYEATQILNRIVARFPNYNSS